jgi:hypothetical protein
LIDPRFLTEPTDRRALAGGLNYCRRFFGAPALKQYFGREILLCEAARTDDELTFGNTNALTIMIGEDATASTAADPAAAVEAA